jgi:hypothetical protein
MRKFICKAFGCVPKEDYMGLVGVASYSQKLANAALTRTPKRDEKGRFLSSKGVARDSLCKANALLQNAMLQLEIGRFDKDELKKTINAAIEIVQKHV